MLAHMEQTGKFMLKLFLHFANKIEIVAHRIIALLKNFCILQK